MTAPDSPRLRADARRNHDALLRAGEQLLERDGAGFSFEEAARLANVGKGTLYRRFASRDHLIAEVLARRFAELAREADELLDAADSGEAVRTWLRSFDRLPLRYRGLSARLGVALSGDGSAVGSACGPMKASFHALLVRSQADGRIRPDVRDSELLGVIASFPDQVRDEEGRARILEVILSGLGPG